MALNPNRLAFTSEKTVEVNVLHDLASCLEQNGFRVTILSPTQIEENTLGFDDQFANLPSGRILALQFKRPFEGNNNFAKFFINREQLRALRIHFPVLNEAFYVFAPFPTTQELLNIRQHLLQSTSIVEIHDRNLRMNRRHRRLIRVDKTNPSNVHLVIRRQLTHVLIGRPASILCPSFASGGFGRPNGDDFDKKYSEFTYLKRKRFNSSGFYIVHISKIESN